MRGHLHVVKALLDKGATPNVVNKLYKTPLLTVHVSSMENKKDLMSKRIDLNIKIQKIFQILVFE